MAKVNNNDITNGLSGKFGDQIVFRRVGDQTFAIKKPGPRKKPATPAQIANEENFRKAILYAKSAMADPAMRAIYQNGRGKRSAFRVAVTDSRIAPVFEKVDINAYTGLPGGEIRVTVTDDFKVVAVNVIIHDVAGLLVEEGRALPATKGLQWVYAAKVLTGSLMGCKITVTASDYPGNTSIHELTMV